MAEEGMPSAGPAPAGPETMSKTLAIVLAVVLLVVGIGVGYGIGFATLQPEEETPDTILERIYQRGFMVVGTDAAFPPFENVDPDTGEIVGFDVDLINAIAEIMGVEVEMRNIGWDAIFTAVPDETVDLAISAMTITEERKQTFLFSQPYFFSNLTAVIKTDGPMVGQIDSVADLEGTSIALQEFTTSDGWVEDTLIGEMGIQPEEVRKTTLFTDAIQLLIAEEVDVVIIDQPVAEAYQAAGQVEIVLEITTNEQFGIPMPRGEVALKGAIDAALAELRETGQYDQIFNKWFGPP